MEVAGQKAARGLQEKRRPGRAGRIARGGGARRSPRGMCAGARACLLLTA